MASDGNEDRFLIDLAGNPGEEIKLVIWPTGADSKKVHWAVISGESTLHGIREHVIFGADRSYKKNTEVCFEGDVLMEGVGDDETAFKLYLGKF